MLLIEAFFRFGSIGILFAIGVLILRDGRHIPALRVALPLIVSLTCLFLTTGTETLRVNGSWAIPLRLFDMLNFIFVWWFGLALFNDDFKLGLREWGIAAVFAALVTPMRLTYLGLDIPWASRLDIAGFIATLALMAHLAYCAFMSRREDLVESRRKLRFGFAIAIAVVVVASIVTERVAYALEADPFMSLFITYVLTFVLGVWAVLWLTRLNPEALTLQMSPAQPAAAPVIELRDIETHRRLVEIMEEQRQYTEHGLSIGSLSDKVGIPEHQLRDLINRSMGYRNFSSFLNHYRLKDVESALADPSNHRTPILTIAINAGFSSLAPFNRAFKSHFDMTPTAYRNQVLHQTSQAGSVAEVMPVQADQN